jgi:hypothetical protein
MVDGDEKLVKKFLKKEFENIIRIKNASVRSCDFSFNSLLYKTADEAIAIQINK